MKFKQLDRNVDYNEAASAVGFDNADRYLQELKEKFEIIDRQESKCKLLGTSQYMEFSVVEINKRPCIKLSAVNVNKCLTGDTITVRIPSFVDCIDTTTWLGWRLIWLVAILQIYRLNKSSQKQKNLI